MLSRLGLELGAFFIGQQSFLFCRNGGGFVLAIFVIGHAKSIPFSVYCWQFVKSKQTSARHVSAVKNDFIFQQPSNPSPVHMDTPRPPDSILAQQVILSVLKTVSSKHLLVQNAFDHVAFREQRKIRANLLFGKHTHTRSERQNDRLVKI